jgi:hypothetical protein
MLNQEYLNFWNRTESSVVLEQFISFNFQGLKDIIINLMAGGSRRVFPVVYQDNVDSVRSIDDVLITLVHLGYLAYDKDTESVYIPNREVNEAFARAASERGWDELIKAIRDSQTLLEAVWQKDSDAVAAAIDAAHQEVSILDYNNEHALSYTVSLAFYIACNYYTIIRELPSGKGFVDVAFIPRKAYADKPAMLIELKSDKSAEAAIAQIHNKNYPQALSDYKGGMILVGINYDQDSKKHSCKIETVEFGG